MQRPKSSKDRLAHGSMQQTCVGKENGPRTALDDEKVKNHFSTDARQLLTEQHIDDPGAADAGFHQYHPLVIADDFADDLSVIPEWMFAHLSQDIRGGVWSYNGEQFTLISYIERIQSENFAGSLDGLPHRNLSLVDDHTDSRGRGDFVQGRGDAAPCGIAQAMDVSAGGQHGSDKRMKCRGVALDRTLEF